jgi:type I site-specific restriction-modification system R (restriction) subunit
VPYKKTILNILFLFTPNLRFNRYLKRRDILEDYSLEIIILLSIFSISFYLLFVLTTSCSSRETDSRGVYEDMYKKAFEKIKCEYWKPMEEKRNGLENKIAFLMTEISKNEKEVPKENQELNSNLANIIEKAKEEAQSTFINPEYKEIRLKLERSIRDSIVEEDLELKQLDSQLKEKTNKLNKLLLETDRILFETNQYVATIKKASKEASNG